MLSRTPYGPHSAGKDLGEHIDAGLSYRNIGLLGGWLFGRLGFGVGNVVQAVIFLLPHLPLLLVSPGL